MKTVYAIFTILGVLVADTLVFIFLRQYGFDLAEVGRQAIASPMAALAWADLVIASFAFWAFMRHEAGKYHIGHLWVFVAMNLLIGLCAALPAFLYVRQGRIEQQRIQSQSQSQSQAQAQAHSQSALQP